MDSTASPRSHPSRPARSWAGGLALLAAGLEFSCACAALFAAAAGICPANGEGGLLGCDVLLRRRLIAPWAGVPLTAVALLGSGLTVVLSVALVAGWLRRGAALGAARLLAGAAGFALGLQVFGPLATGRACPLCLGVAASASLAAVFFAVEVRGRHGLRWVWPVFALCLVASAGAATVTGRRIAAEDARRRAAVRSAGAAAAGPELWVVVREGCPFCEALLLDGLGEPELLQRLTAVRGVRVVAAASPAGQPFAREGVPVLVLRAPGGEELARLRGARPPEEIARWLDRALRRGGVNAPR
ncbi:MAG: hypothetical protein D6731_23430 [Planctomycetota bacterium]|nr:MAG: hypothetical protein D6731_23430 [Planctomycetota bacterium]